MAGNEKQPDLEALNAFVDSAAAKAGRGREAVIPVLQAIQNEFRYLPEAALRRVCEVTEITPADIAGVSSFYTQFRHRPVGQHVINICHGTACHVKGAATVTDALLRHLRVPPGDDTDPDGVFTVEKVACLGCCTLAPVMQIDGVTYGHLTPENIPTALRDFLELRRSPAGDERREPVVPADGMGEIRVCLDSCCRAGGTQAVFDALEQAVEDSAARAVVKRVGCVLMCYHTPLVEVLEPGKAPALYARVEPADAAAIVQRHFRPGSIGRRVRAAASRRLERLLTDEVWAPVTRYSIDVRDEPVCEFLGPQRHLALEHCGSDDPLDAAAYEARKGFAAIRRCLDGTPPEEAIGIIARSGLSGRGGAGFPTGRKWSAVRAAPGDGKYVVCNGDEGDPGAFMDRMLLETFPFRVIEGMMVAAYAVGAGEGIFYIRAEYPLAIRRMREALGICEERGLLGEGAFGGRLGLKLRIMEGAGAFVCGEETALIASIEGRRGMPRLRPPYPAQSGLWGRPTLINNVETLALVPWIIRNGPEAFAAMGTSGSKGTKVFALAGKVARGGLIEVPMGTTIRQIVEEIGGGIAGGRTFKAVQIGGPSGGCIPASLADTPIDYTQLQQHGAIMGSGGLVVLDDTDCMVDVARYFLQFTQDQSCGKCTFCRVGTRHMLDIILRLCRGAGRKGDLEELEELALMVKRGSLCGLGQTAPNPVLTTLRHFRDEYEAHLAGHCPAGRCKDLVRYVITDDCIGCTRCAQHCPAQAIEMRPYQKHEIDATKCTRCDTCRKVCRANAVRVQ